MPIDFDPFDTLDLNHDMQVDASDLRAYEFAEHGTYSLNDLDHDMIMDQFDTDLNNDLRMDETQTDLNSNMIMDQYEVSHGPTSFQYDLNHDNRIDALDAALAKSMYKL
ncbi:hypothetical protein [Bacillus sp. SG-1]|uniref:hypothetical protein n=1 Tax=Bacillus sp. SG-1 TaxID=161544 RepID=UPI0001544B3D|nr:hypothetical protein [Bacillus sp. SG-1]EDL63064.1 hypothetical protein BSG1_20600 [Bacillus sp. SG-1]